MDINKRYKTLIDLWKSSFVVHNDLSKIDSILLSNVKRNDLKFPVLENNQLFPSIVGASALLLSIFKEKIIPHNFYEFNLVNDNLKFKQIISKIITIKDNKVYVGNILFDNEINAFNYLRNKLLHGEYYLDNDYIFLENGKNYLKISVSQLTDLILNLQQFIENILDDNSLKITINSLINYISVLIHYTLNDGESIYYDYLAQSMKSITFLDDITIASEFVCFYSKFHYGLDNLYSNGRFTNISELLKKEKFDFSLLDLKQFDDLNMTMDIKLYNFDEQVKKIRNDYNKSYSLFIKIEKQFKNYMSKKNINENKLKQIENNFLLVKKKYESQKILNDRLDLFDIHKYERYINIINHIRNAFAHGNISIEPYKHGDTLLDRIINIEDIYDEKRTYKNKFSYKSFSLLFNFESNKILSDYVEYVVNDENKINTLRNMQLEINDSYGYIIEEKYEEWKRIIHHFLVKNDDRELIYIQLAYCQMETINIMKDNFDIIDYCQNLISFINYYKREEKKLSLQLHGNYDDTINLLECYDKINYYVINYCQYCPDLMKKAYIDGNLPKPIIQK